MSLVKPCTRALSKATTTKIKINEIGLLSIQHSVPVTNQRDLVNWVEYLVLHTTTDN